MTAALTTTELDYDELPLILELGRHLVDSGMMPKHVRNPGAALACVLAGRELGLGPMASIRGLHMVEGRVVLSADTMLAIAIKRGIRHRWLCKDDQCATIRLERAGFAPMEHSFSAAEAGDAGLLGRKNWKAYRPAMLRARCITSALRAYAPDLFVGHYDPDEARDFTPEPAAEVIEVEVVPEPAPPSGQRKARDAFRGKVQRMWFARLKELGFSLDDDQRHAVQAALLGAHSLSDLTWQEVRDAGLLLRDSSYDDLRGRIESALRACGGEE